MDTEEESRVQGFGIIYPKQKTEEKESTNEEESGTEERFITAQELVANRVPERGNFRLLKYLARILHAKLIIWNVSQIVEYYQYSKIIKLVLHLVGFTLKTYPNT